jgi:hypothetical protein
MYVEHLGHVDAHMNFQSNVRSSPILKIDIFLKYNATYSTTLIVDVTLHY